MDDNEYTDTSKGREDTSSSEIKSLISKLKQHADDEGCSVMDLVEKYEGDDAEMESDEGEAEGGDKLALIVARMKSKAGSSGEE